jgi:hypothetical protein
VTDEVRVGIPLIETVCARAELVVQLADSETPPLHEPVTTAPTLI